MSIGRLLDSDGNSVITAKDLGNIIAGNSAAKKIFIQNDDLTRDTGAVTGIISQFGSQGLYSLLKWALCPDTLSCPFNVSAILSSAGNLNATTTYYYRITAFNNKGETVGSIEVSGLTTVSDKTINLAWSKVEGAVGYCIYRSTSSESYSSARRHVILDPDILAWTDTGQAADPSGPYSFPGINTDFDLPTENTTAGEGPDYGTPPTLSAGNLSVDILGSGQQKAIWIGADTLVSTPPGSTNAYIDFSET